jgi:hypothetical protein
MTTAWRIACGQHFDDKDGKIFSTSGPHQTRKASGRSHGQNTDHYSLRVEKNGADKKKRRLLRGRGRLRAESACGLWLLIVKFAFSEWTSSVFGRLDSGLVIGGTF